MYRIEIEALNALIVEQRRTNELLEKMLERGMTDGLHKNGEEPVNDTVGVECDIRGTSVQVGDVQPDKGTSKRKSIRDDKPTGIV